jgi:hypothetical protein
MHKNATKCKQNTKQICVKQAWSIKNYRYVCDVSEIIAIIITDASPSTIHDSPIHV